MRLNILKRFIVVLAIVSIIPVIVGCLNPISLDQYGYVISIGVDVGEEKDYYLTLMLQRESNAQDNQSEGGAIFLAAEGNNFFEAVALIESNVSYSLNFTRTAFFIFSSELCEKGQLEEFLGFSFDSLKIRPSAIVILAEGAAKEYLGGLSADNDANITKLQTALMRDQHNRGEIILSNLSMLLEACHGGRFDICMALGSYNDDIVTDMEQKKSENEGNDPLEEVKIGERVGGLKSITAGTALFDGWIMVGTLDSYETLILSIAKGEFEQGRLSFKTENDAAILVHGTLENIKTNVKISDVGEITADIEIELSIDLLQDNSDLSQSELRCFLEKTAAKQLEEDIWNVFRKCQELESDAVGFGKHFSKLFGTVSEWNKFDWKKQYSKLEADFNVILDFESEYNARNS